MVVLWKRGKMKIVCDKCLKVVEKSEGERWLIITTNYNLDYILCPDCENGFWQAVDNELPPIQKDALLEKK